MSCADIICSGGRYAADQAWGTAPLSTADHRGGRQVKEVLHPCKGSHRIVSRDGASDLNTKLVYEGGSLGIHARELNEAESVTGEATGGFNDERDKAHKCAHLVAQDRVFFCSERTWKALDDPGRAGMRTPDALMADLGR